MKKVYTKILCLLLVSIRFSLFAQETKTQTPAPTTKESSKTETTPPVTNSTQDTGNPIGKGDEDPKNPKDAGVSTALAGQAAGSSPTASPEASFQNRFLDIPVNTFTGTAQAPIPIYTISEGNISVPVAISYNASGVKAHEVAAWTGMNSVLSAGATISRIVRGIPDEGKLEYSTFGSNSSSTRKGSYQHGIKANNDNNNDSESDLYLLNVNGGSYKFTFESILRTDVVTGESYRKAVFFPDADIEVRLTYQHFKPYGESSINYNIGRFVNWRVTMPDGMIYTFAGTPETTESSFEIEAKTARNQGVYEGGNELYRYAKNNQITSAWNLTKITSPFGNHVDFTYTPSRYGYYKLAEQEVQTNNCTFSSMTQTINKVYVQGSSLSEINSQTVKLKVNNNYWDCVPNPNWNDGNSGEDEFICGMMSDAPKRIDVDTWQKDPLGTAFDQTPPNLSAKLLSKITVQDQNNTSGKVLEWNFEYENINSGFYDLDPSAYGYSYGEVGYTHQRRMFLKKITLPDNNFYRFTYSKTSTIPSRLTRRIDHWGFFNNPTFNYVGLIGKDYTRPCVSVGTSRDTDNSGSYAQYFTIDSLISSTGTVITFTFDNHEAQNFTGKIGGSRIRKVETLDLISGIKTIKTYDYLQSDGSTSSGFIALKPLYHFTDLNNNEQWNSGIYSQLLGLLGKPAVGYSRVVEKMVSPFENTSSLGYTVSEFSQSLTEANMVVASPYVVRPWTTHFYQDYENGVPIRVASYNSNNQIIHEKITSYAFASSDNSAITGYKSFRLNGFNYNFEQSYTESLSKFRLKSDVVKAYSQDGTNPVVNTNTYTYKDEMSVAYRQAYQGKHNQVVKTESYDSYGYLNETINKYAIDFTFGEDSTAYQVCYDYFGNIVDCSDPSVNPDITQTYYNKYDHIPTDIEAKGIWQLQQKKMWATVLETVAKKNTKVVSATYQNFYADSTQYHQAGLGKESYMAQNLPLTTFSELKYNRTTTGESLDRDERYDLRTTIEKYNPLGMPAVVQTRFGSRDSTVYNATNTLVLEQHNNIQAYDKNRTKLEYNTVIFGVSKETATNDLEAVKEYYDNGKIKQIKDKDGNIIKHYQYYYRGQADNDTHVNTDSDKNRIITRTPRVATTDATTLDYDQCLIAVTYMDGAGKTLQSVAYKASPNQKDMISGVTLFDEFGRPNKSILPIESNYNDGRYTHVGILDFGDFSSRYPSDYVANVQSVIAKARIFYNDNAPYSEINVYESSPLSRTFKTFGAGQAWRDNDKSTQVQYETATGIKKFTVLHDNTTVSVGTYSGYELTKKTLIDERGSLVVEYKDKSGNVIQKDVQVDGTETNPVFLTTANIFDDIGRLRYTLNPKAYNALSGLSSFDETNANFEPNVYAYKYDWRNRITDKHSPSLGWAKLIYNRLNQVVLTQDSQEALTNTWNFIKYDGHGRTVQTGQLVATQNASIIQRNFNFFSDEKQYEEKSSSSGNVQQYTNRSYYSTLGSLITDASLKTVSYFDDYNWRYDNPYSGSIADYGFQTNPFNASAYSANNAKGMATGGLTKIEMYDDFLFPSAIYYDDKNRVTQSIGYQNLLARNQSDMQYNFVGDVLQNRMIYRKSGDADRVRTTEQVLDHTGRRKELYYTLKEGSVDKVPRMRMVSYAYDAIGRLKTKGIQQTNAQSTKQSGLWTDANTWLKGIIPTINDAVVINQGHTVTIPTNQTVTAGSLYDKGTLIFQQNSILSMGTLPANQSNAALQFIEYSYNVRGSLRGLNLSDVGSLATSQEKLFSYKLDYQETGKYFDGSVSAQSWKYNNSPLSRSYEFTYDRANRLKNAIYSGGQTGENFSIPTINYDVNGNITFLSRMGKSGTSTVKIDSLDYQYFNNGDQLKTVTDYASNAQADGFKNGSNTGDDYEYYADGKLKKDLNRNISLIEYNFLDLVSKISRGNGDYIEYKYTSTGTKRQTKRVIGGVESYTLFDGEIIYNYTGTNPTLGNFTVSEVQNEEGRFVNNRLEYGYTDHLGNLRLSYYDSLGTPAIVQINAYDAWGMEIRPLRYLANGSQADRYTWQGKEDLSGDGLEDWSDFGWRIEDRTLGRWFTPDPADQFESISTYAYCANNPVSHIDPDGRALPVIAVGALIGAGISALTYTASVAFSEGGFNNWNWGSFAKSVGVGAVSGALSSGIGQAYGGIGDFSKELSRAFTHGIVQANVSAFTGGDVGSAFLSSFIGSGVGSGTNGLSKAGQLGVSALMGAGLSTAMNGGNFWENLAYSSAVVGLNHAMHKGGKKPKAKKDQLDPSTTKKNLFHLTYPGGDNPKTYGGKYDYTYIPESLAEYPAIGHDRRYDNLGVEGLSGLVGDTRAIGADYKFVGEEFSIAHIKILHPLQRVQALGLGVGLGLMALPKTIWQFSKPMGSGLFETMMYYNISNRGVTNAPSK